MATAGQPLKYHRRSAVSVSASLVPSRCGSPGPWRAALVVAVLLGAARVTGAQTPTAPAAPAPPSAPASGSPLPDWLQVHAEQRTRYETIDARYRPTEVGGDQQLGFRTRLQVGAATPAVWAFAEFQDSRVTLDDSASTLNIGTGAKTKVQQLHAGLAWRNAGGHGVTYQIEGGRFSRNIGSRRLISRNIYANSTTAYDGLIVAAVGKTWSVSALATRPVFYSYPSLTRDPRLVSLRFGGLYATTSRVKAANADLYGLVWHDGGNTPAATRRSLNTVGARIYGAFGPKRRADYENEITVQGGEVGPRAHRAWMQHARVGYHFDDTAWKPNVLAVWDYASGDADPTDAKSGAFDPLIGDRRFEFGPVGLYGLIARTNLISPGVWVILHPTPPLETWLQLRGIWLAESRDRWRPGGLADLTGASGTHVGTQLEWRTRYRFGRHLEFDGGVTVLDESRFLRALKPTANGHTVHFYAGLDVHY